MRTEDVLVVGENVVHLKSCLLNFLDTITVCVFPASQQLLLQLCPSCLSAPNLLSDEMVPSRADQAASFEILGVKKEKDVDKLFPAPSILQ